MIFCFSACGNTALVADRLAKILGERVVMINSSTEDSFDLRSHRRVIWAFPVYSWGIPMEVRHFMKNVRLKTDGNVPHFMVSTCGDDAGLTARMWRSLMKKRGWSAKSAHTVIMPNTYVTLPGFDTDSHEIAEEKLLKMPARTAEIAHAIKCCSPVDSVVRGRFAWLKTTVIYPLFMRFLTSPKPFHAADSCTGCGKCSKVCPMGNILLENHKPEWGNRCTMCLACYHHCPHKSVEYGKRTRDKGQYTAPKEI